MYLKLIIPLIFFNVIHCFKSKEYLEERLTEIRNNAKRIYSINANACINMVVNSIEKFQICQRVFSLLRDDISTENPYDSISMNYKAFKQSPVCEEKSVWISLHLIAVTLMSLNCYGQPSILNSDTSPDTSNNKYLKEISVFRGINGTLIVIKCNPLRECEVIESYDAIEWQQYSNITPEVSDISVPQTATIDKLQSAFSEGLLNIQEMRYSRSYLLGQYISCDSAGGLGSLCDLLFRRSQYFLKCKLDVFRVSLQTYVRCKNITVTIFQPFITIEHLKSYSRIGPDHFKNEKRTFPSFACNRYKLAGKHERSFRIISGPDDSSVIILEPVTFKIHKKHETTWVPVELIENLHWNYVLHFREWF